jgi:hypothetical protein
MLHDPRIRLSASHAQANPEESRKTGYAGRGRFPLAPASRSDIIILLNDITSVSIMVRTVISLDPEDKAWLDRKAQETGKPMTALVREAVTRYRSEDGRRGKASLGDLLDKTRGLWKRGDGLAWQKKMRDEWER